jgi:hypothetical protein
MADYPRFLMGKPKIDVIHGAGDDYVAWSFTEEIIGLQLSESVAIAADGTTFDPRTLSRDEDGTIRARPAAFETEDVDPGVGP